MVSFLTHKRALTFCLILVSVMFLFHTGASLAGEKDTSPGKEFSGVDFKNGLLKVSVDKQSSKKVMSEIAKKAGIQILIYFPAEEELTIGFDYLPLEKGLKKILRGKNYAFYRSREDQQSDRLTSVMVFNREEGVSVAMRDEIMNLDQQQMLDRIQQELSLNGGNLRKQIDEAMEKAKKMDIHEEMTKLKDALSQGGVEVGSIEIEKISAALETIKKDGVKSR
jgi:hypothetical protein